MKRWLVTLVVFVSCLVPLHADLTFTQTMTMEGGSMAAMMAGKPMVMTTRVKGKKARADMEVMGTRITSLTDLATKEITILNHTEKTAQVISATSTAKVEVPKFAIDFTLKPTGQSKAIDGVQCDEHAFKMTFAFAEMSGKQMPPEAAEALKDLKMLMDGSIWVSKGGPGAAEYTAFQKAAVEAKLASALAGLMGGESRGGIDKLMAAVSEAPGIPYLSEITIDVEGTSPMVEMMKKQMSGTKMVQKTTGVSTEALTDDLFKVPGDYKVKK